MKELVKKLNDLVKKKGLSAAGLKIFKYPFILINRLRFSNGVLSLPSTEDRFTWIYKKNYWKSEESSSGQGSTLKYTENLRKELPRLFTDFSIRKIFDAPCGDFNWIRYLLKEVSVDYLGGDIVLPMIDSLRVRYENTNVKFIHIDLIKGPIPKSDLMICRDCLFHLSFSDTISVLRNFLASDTPYLLTTTHKNLGGFKNKDIRTGDFRFIDLFSSPYNFPSNPLRRIADWISPDPAREMCLWSRDQILQALTKNK